MKENVNNVNIQNNKLNSKDAKDDERKIDGIHIKKGFEIGRFNLGSTVVLIFESD